jgi:hypothetical protein
VSDPNAPPPKVSALRLVGAAAAHAKGRLSAPLGASFADDVDAQAVVLGPGDAEDAEAIARALPDADALAEGTLVLVLPEVVTSASLAARVLAALGRGRTVPRALRCTALVARGYVDVAAGIDPTTRADLAWGYAPPPIDDA